MLWTAEQAEAWMRANPGRWLEDNEGDMWIFDGLHFLECPVDSDGYGPSVTVALTPAEAAEDNLSLTFHPPREHWAAEREIREAKILGLKDAMRSRWERYSLLRADSGDASDWGARQQELEELQDMVNTLFRAAPEGS